MGRKIIDLIGKKFGYLTVISMSNRRSKKSEIYWNCECDCGTFTEVCGTDLRNNKINSCIECGRIRQSNKIKKYNEYKKINDNITAGYSTNDNSEFYFNTKYLDSIKEFAWRTDSDGYICTQLEGKEIRIHRFIMEEKLQRKLEKEEFVDHEDKDPKNNKDDNLRLCSNEQNAKNRKINKNNKTGISGVIEKIGLTGKIYFISTINVNGKHKHLISTQNFQEAVITRLKAEKEYYGEFAPQKHLFEQYGV